MVACDGGGRLDGGPDHVLREPLHRGRDEVARPQERGSDVTRSVEPVVADFHEALRQNMLHEAAEKLDAGNGRGGAVLRRKPNEMAISRDEATIRDPNAMGIATEVREHMLRSTEGFLGVDDPTLLREPGHDASEGLRVTKVVEFGKNTLAVESLDRVEKLAAKQRAQDTDGEQEVSFRNPSCTV